MTQLPSFDQERLNYLTELFGDSESVRELFLEFLEACPAWVSTMKQGINEQRPDLVEFAAHAIRGTSANISVTNIEKTSAALESIVQRQQLDLAGAYISELEEQIDGLREHIERRAAI
ncbi:MAG: HPt (histidine-containing phosphotransfer) domain-containing protein [Myxococcota bacterium]|jgi:HPt (histidine-containing phosphotransfer) domain-containing protein